MQVTRKHYWDYEPKIRIKLIAIDGRLFSNDRSFGEFLPHLGIFLADELGKCEDLWTRNSLTGEQMRELWALHGRIDAPPDGADVFIYAEDLRRNEESKEQN
jgi:hypothetical protein